MRDSEELAFRYLSSLGLAAKYEPDGNVPPDFVVNGRIAIEVRRLNQSVIVESGAIIGIEKAQFDLLRCVRAVLISLGPPPAGHSWFVHYSFNRPLPSLAKLRHDIRGVLLAFRDGCTAEMEFSICDSFSLDLTPCTNIFPTCFVLGGYQDFDSGGWLVAELERNIRICTLEKEQKIAAVRSKYREWWLILIDCIGFGARECLNVRHGWDRVILVNPLAPEMGYDL